MAFEWWMVTAGANVVMVTVFGLMAYKMLYALHAGKQWGRNPILTATAAVFVTCTLGHGVHLLHVLEPYMTGPAFAAFGFNAGIGVATQVSFADPVLIAWDAFTALIAIVFWIVRSRLEYLVHGHALNEDMAARQEQAMDIHDNVVQGLVEAKMALDMGDRVGGLQAIDRSLAQAKEITTDLLGGESSSQKVRLGRRDLRLEEGD